MEVCSYSVPKSGVLLIGDEILQPVPYAGPEKEYDGKVKGTFFVKDGQTLRRYCPADKVSVLPYSVLCLYPLLTEIIFSFFWQNNYIKYFSISMNDVCLALSAHLSYVSDLTNKKF